MAQCPSRRWRGGARWGFGGAPSSALPHHCSKGFLLPVPLFWIFICRPQAGASCCAPQAGFGMGRCPCCTMAPCSTYWSLVCSPETLFLLFFCSLIFFINFYNSVIKNGHALLRLIKTTLLVVRRLALELGKEDFYMFFPSVKKMGLRDGVGSK